MNLMQNFFPLSRNPYEDIAKKMGIDREEVISRLKKLCDSGIIRKIGAILSPKKIGFESTLAAVAVPLGKIEEVAEIINEYQGVTHNYLREGSPNIWFTLIEPNQQVLERNLNEIESKINFKIIKLPAKKTFKIGVKFDIK